MRRLPRVPPGLPRHGGRENGEVQEPDERASGNFQHTQHGAPVISQHGEFAAQLEK
jgi:hypothetical protein